MRYSSRLLAFTLILSLCIVIGCGQKKEKPAMEEETMADLQLDKIPQVVMDGLKAKFPQAEIHKWTQEKEGDTVIYDFEFTQEGQKFEADIREDGSIHNWEKAIELVDLPEAVKLAVEAKYPGAIMKEIMEIATVVDDQDKLEGYEVVLETTDMKDVEVMVAPDGGIIEDSGEMMMEEESHNAHQ
jgi:hypothetical protein